MRLIICGMGVVGQSFVKLLIDSSESLYKKYGIKPRIVACADSNGVAYSKTGLDLEKLLIVKKSMELLPNIQKKNYILKTI